MQPKSRWITTAAILLLLLGITCGCAWIWQNRQAPTTTSTTQNTTQTLAPPRPNHLLLGNPSNATPNALTNGNNYLINRPQYALAYNNAKRIPNWVSWELNSSWIGDIPRRDSFRPDDNLPNNWYKVTPSDYTRSGFDRGHMIPAADRDNTADNQASTFLMTNIVPQTPDNNRGPWVRLEEYARTLASKGKQLYIIAGTYGKKTTIGPAQTPIVVPASLWKVIVIFDRPVRSPREIGPEIKTIAVEIPNIDGIKTEGWGKYRVTIDQIEQKTGYDLLNQIPVEVQAKLESRIN